MEADETVSEDVKPITPQEAKARKSSDIPGWVIGVWNGLIAANVNSNAVAVIRQEDATAAILKAAKTVPGIKVTAQDLFDRGWLDIEDAYRNAGWVVVYDKPAYNESYEATFQFSGKR